MYGTSQVVDLIFALFTGLWLASEMFITPPIDCSVATNITNTTTSVTTTATFGVTEDDVSTFCIYTCHPTVMYYSLVYYITLTLLHLPAWFIIIWFIIYFISGIICQMVRHIAMLSYLLLYRYTRSFKLLDIHVVVDACKFDSE